MQIRVETSEGKLVEYQKAHEIIGPDEKNNVVMTKLSALATELNGAEADRIQKESLYRYSAGTPADSSVISNSGADLLGKLHSQESDLRVQIGQARIHLGPNHPKLLEMKNHLQEIQNAIKAESETAVQRQRSDYFAALQREKMLRAAFEQQKAEANKLNQSAIEYSLLKREAESNRTLYDGLLQKLKEANLTAGLNSSNVRIVDRARPPLGPSQPNIPRNYELGLMVSLLSGLALAFIVETMDNTVTTFDVAESAIGVRALGLVPLYSSVRRDLALQNRGLLARLNGRGGSPHGEIVAISRPRSEIAEAYRAIRTSVLFAGINLNTPPKVILVTSPAPGDGKTTTSVNIAAVLAQRGFKVLLVDADLRRPSVLRHFGLKANGGLTEVLTGHRTVSSCTLSAPRLPNLTVLPAGSIAKQPSELVSSELMRDLIHQWRQEYDHIVIDSSPILSVTDAVILAAESDGVVLVVRSGHTTRSALRRSQGLLDQVGAKTLGVVLNGVDLRSPDYRHYYYAGYRQGYGGYYTDNKA